MADETAVAETEETAVEVDDAREEMLAAITNELGDAVVESFVKPGDDVWIRVSRDAWVETANVLKSGLGFGFFNFLSAIDWLPSPYGRDMDAQADLAMSPPEPVEAAPIETGYAGGDTRFQVFARVNDIQNARAVTIKVDLPDDDLSLNTWIPVYPGANWHEREAREMFGIDFTGHPNPRHLYLPGAFEGFPMRKDFALLARRIKPWPGIVDVEQMPGEDDEASDDASNGGDA
ncbi:MAG: NADH-quinone oxidoreductase subunit C [Verrucomicrobiales bacterium]|jgi:NADH-quinone oxidoreductase subunit C